MTQDNFGITTGDLETIVSALRTAARSNDAAYNDASQKAAAFASAGEHERAEIEGKHCANFCAAAGNMRALATKLARNLK